MLKIHKINVYSIASEFDIFSQELICLYLLHKFSKWHLWEIFMEKLAKLHYINLAFIPDVTSKQNSPLAPKQKILRL